MPPADAESEAFRRRYASSVQIAQAHRLTHPEVTSPCKEFRLWLYLHRHLYQHSFRAAIEQEWDAVSCDLQQCATLVAVIEQFVRAQKVLNASSARTYTAWAHKTARQYLTPFFGTEALFELKVDDDKGLCVLSRRDQIIDMQLLQSSHMSGFLELMSSSQMQLAAYQAPGCLIDLSRGQQGAMFGPICLLNSSAGNHRPSTFRLVANNMSIDTRQRRTQEAVAAQAANRVLVQMEQAESILGEKASRSTRLTNADHVLESQEILALESKVQTNMKAAAHRAAFQGKLSSVLSCDRTPGEVKITFASKNARQIQLQRGQELTLSYNTQIQRAPVDNAHSTQHVLKRERQSTEVIEGQNNRRKQRIVALQSEAGGLSLQRSLRSTGRTYLLSNETQHRLQRQMTLRSSFK